MHCHDNSKFSYLRNVMEGANHINSQDETWIIKVKKVQKNNIEDINIINLHT